jgi:hypothetical protein
MLTGGRSRSVCALFALALIAAPSAQAAERASVAAVNGNIVLTVSGKQIQLTTSGTDLDPVLSPNGSLVVFTRKTTVAATSMCTLAVAEKRELWVIGADKSKPRKLLTSKDAQDPKAMLCDFTHKQFNSDGRKVLFETPAWATSGALHEIDLTTNKERYIAASNGFRVLTDCAMREYRNQLVISQHRYYVFGGSYDWYWLFSPDGKRELGAIGTDLGPLEEACDLDLDLAVRAPSVPSTPAPAEPPEP